METLKHFIHTGDVQMIESELPKDAVLISKRPVAYGEKSGHQHVITGDYEMFEDKKSKSIFIKTGPKGAWSQHVHESVMEKANFDTLELLQKADHNPSQLLPGLVYRVGIHQAYDPYLKIKNRVLD